ncbi:MAG: ferrous iron transport protein A [Planctomycetaceae bacterium]|nr:ferrous iron transport protein A [Planctomycetaceae bacterium]
MARTLTGLSRGETATIASVSGDDAIALRILEMGLTDGEEVTFLGSAPLGDPLEFSVRGYRISLRAAEAERVRLTTEEVRSENGSSEKWE